MQQIGSSARVTLRTYLIEDTTDSKKAEHEILRKAVEGLDATLEYLRIIGSWHMEEAQEAVNSLRELLPSHLLDV